MTERAERIFEQSLTLVPEARAAFVGGECKGDARLHEEVIALLNEAEDADKFFDRLDEAVFCSPPSDSDGEPSPDVAPKLLPSDLGAESEEQARLLEEARAVAALDHPGV